MKISKLFCCSGIYVITLDKIKYLTQKLLRLVEIMFKIPIGSLACYKEGHQFNRLLVHQWILMEKICPESQFPCFPEWWNSTTLLLNPIRNRATLRSHFPQIPSSSSDTYSRTYSTIQTSYCKTFKLKLQTPYHNLKLTIKSKNFW